MVLTRFFAWVKQATTDAGETEVIITQLEKTWLTLTNKTL